MRFDEDRVSQYSDALGWLSRADPASGGASKTGHALDVYRKAWRVYRRHRSMGLNLLQLPTGRVPSATLFRFCLRWKHCMKSEDVALIAADACGLVTEVLIRRSDVLKAEFVFLSLWTGNIQWAAAARSIYCEHWRHGLEQLADLATHESGDALARSFVGLGDGRSAWEAYSEGPDGGDIETGLFIDEPLYMRHVHGRLTGLREELIALTRICNAR